jgi:hypothetical protein
MEFSVWELPPSCWQLEGWPSGSTSVLVGKIFPSTASLALFATPLSISTSLVCGLDHDDSTEKWLINDGILKGLFGKRRIQVDGRGLKGILRNFEL